MRNSATPAEVHSTMCTARTVGCVAPHASFGLRVIEMTNSAMVAMSMSGARIGPPPICVLTLRNNSWPRVWSPGTAHAPPVPMRNCRPSSARTTKKMLRAPVRSGRA
jgi:hypothetical protein